MRPFIAFGMLVSAGLLLAPGRLSAQATLPPEDGWLVWQSTREEGRNEVYLGRADGTDVKRLTHSGGFRMSWAPDGRWIAYTDEAGVYLVRPDGSETVKLADEGFPAFWLHDNSGVVVSVGTDYSLHDPETKEKVPLFGVDDYPVFAGSSFLPNAVTHDNRYLLLGSHLFTNGYTASNGSFKHGFSAVMVDLLQKDKLYFIGSGCWPFSPPAGDLVFHICFDCPGYPDIMRLDVKDIATRSSYVPEVSNPDAEWGHEYNPRVSNDNKWIAYMSSTGCHEGYHCDYEIFLHRLGTGPTERIRVTNSPTFDGYPDIHVGPLWQKSDQPRLLLTPSRLTFHALKDVPLRTETVKIKNDGGGTLGAVRATVDPPVPWLSLESTANTFQLGLRPGALTRGRHEATVTVTVEGLPGPATRFPVAVLADDSYPAALSPSEPTDGGVVDAAADPDGGAAGPGAPGDSGCGCALGSRGQPGAPAGGLALLALLALRAARRRR